MDLAVGEEFLKRQEQGSVYTVLRSKIEFRYTESVISDRFLLFGK